MSNQIKDLFNSSLKLIVKMMTGGSRCSICLRHTLFALVFIVGCGICFATNIVTYTLCERNTGIPDKLSMTLNRISNVGGKTRISVDLLCSNTPFTIYKTEWINCDSVYSPLEPFSLTADGKEVIGKKTEWHIAIDFPFRDTFDDKDALLFFTDRGVVRCLTTPTANLKEQIDILNDGYKQKLYLTKRSSRNAWTVLGIVVGVVLVLGMGVFLLIRRDVRRRRKEVEDLSMMLAEKVDMDRDQKFKIDRLYGSRFDTLNMLCNEYFEKSASDKLKLTLFNEVEKHILALRDDKSVAELEDIVNACLDDILVRVREQIPSLSQNDLRFLTYLYAGFSPRAVCVFSNIKIKNFYNRRSRLKERILATDAPDREYFVSKM